MPTEQPYATLHHILVNQTQPNGSQQKVPLTGRVHLHSHGLAFEENDGEYYDDKDCALMNYAQEHYLFWQTRYAPASDIFNSPGIFGENFATRGMTEQTVCVGDIFQLGTAQIQVSWGREACRTMAERLHDDQAPEIMHQHSRNGWFYRVLQAGETQPGEKFHLLDRPHPGWTLDRIQKSIFNYCVDTAELEAITKLNALAAPWRERIVNRLSQREPQ